MSSTPTTSPAPRAVDGLVASDPHPLPFAPDLVIRSFRLRREAGDILVYGAPDLPGPEPLSRWYLGHRHEAMFLPSTAPAPLFVHAEDPVEGARGTFTRRHTLEDDFEVIPIPGHTPGSTAFLHDDGERRLLFTADSILLDDGQWVAAVMPSSDRRAYLESLELLRDLDFDVLVPWAATKGQPYAAPTDREDARRRIGWIIDRVRDGGSS